MPHMLIIQQMQMRGYMGISVLLPAVDAHAITEAAIVSLLENAADPENVEIIIYDNASKVPYVASTYCDNDWCNKIIVRRNELNVAGYGALLDTMPQFTHDIILWMHNDVKVHEFGWDKRIIAEFDKDPLLGIAGFFGAYGVADNGGRIGSMGNMLGKEWGTPQHMHGQVMTETYPAVVFDALAMIINRTLFNALDKPDGIPVHHWNDRILPLLFVLQGYHALTIGIAFDHKGGVSSLGNSYRELAERWSNENNIPFQKDWDFTFYNAGEQLFRRLGAGKFPIYVNADFSVQVG